MGIKEIERSVSRETLDDLKRYGEILKKWNSTINLVAKSTLDDLWERHILDGLQIWPLLPEAMSLIDIGSGGGIPALPLAIAAKHHGRIGNITMIESDQRKAAFLSTVVGELGLQASVLAIRAEDAAPQSADICTARALAPCARLFEYSHRHVKSGGKGFFLKGKRIDYELKEARKAWRFSLCSHSSKTHAKAKIIEIGELKRV